MRVRRLPSKCNVVLLPFLLHRRYTVGCLIYLYPVFCCPNFRLPFFPRLQMFPFFYDAFFRCPIFRLPIFPLPNFPVAHFSCSPIFRLPFQLPFTVAVFTVNQLAASANKIWHRLQRQNKSRIKSASPDEIMLEATFLIHRQKHWSNIK